MIELTDKEKDMLKCAFAILEDCNVCSCDKECQGDDTLYEEGRKLLIKFGVLN